MTVAVGCSSATTYKALSPGRASRYNWPCQACLKLWNWGEGLPFQDPHSGWLIPNSIRCLTGSNTL